MRPFVPALALLIALPCLSGCKRATQSNPTSNVATNPHKQDSAMSQGRATLPRAMEYSNMRINEETEDWLGWDMQLLQVDGAYRFIAFCGEGVPEGPVYGHLYSLKGLQIIQSYNDICGGSLKLEFVANGVYVTVGNSDREFVPRHKNFIKQEKFK